MRFVSAAGLKLMKKNAPLGGLRMKSLMPKVLWTSVLLSGLVTACGGSSGRRGGGGPDSQLTSLKIGSMGGEWAKMDVSFESVSRKNPFQKYEFQKADFKQDGVENVNIVVKQDEYYIDLNYFDQQNKLLMRSCPESKSYKHNMVGKSEYKTNIDVCT